MVQGEWRCHFCERGQAPSVRPTHLPYQKVLFCPALLSLGRIRGFLRHRRSRRATREDAELYPDGVEVEVSYYARPQDTAIGRQVRPRLPAWPGLACVHASGCPRAGLRCHAGHQLHRHMRRAVR
jgi:hypothetical protein